MAVRARPRRADVLLALLVAVAEVVGTVIAPMDPPYRQIGPLEAVLVAASALTLAWRRTATAVTAVVAAGLLVVNSAVGYDVRLMQVVPWLALYACFAAGGVVLWTVGTVSCVLSVIGAVALDRSHVGPPAMAGIVACFLIATISGEASRSRRAAVVAERSRSQSEVRERTLALERLQLDERGRLAAELHDALGHTVNVMVLQAGVARRVFDDNPTFAREALVSIETIGREAVEELDRVLGLLGGTDRTPAAVVDRVGPADLRGLAERIRATGRDVRVEVDQAPLPPGTGRALYRIVQEALTNTVRHTRSGVIHLRVSQGGGQVRAEVLNEGTGFPTPVPGHGLTGMRERARLEGGTFEAGPVDGGFRVLAVLPLRPDPEAGPEA